MRTRGSARFAPYYKVQEYDLRWAVWVDVQKAHATPEAARAAYRPSVRCRVMEITSAAGARFGKRRSSSQCGLGVFCRSRTTNGTGHRTLPGLVARPATS